MTSFKNPIIVPTADNGQVYLQQQTITNESQFGTPIPSPWGDLRYVLDQDKFYRFDVEEIDISYNFWIRESKQTFLSAVSFGSVSNTIVNLNGDITKPVMGCVDISFWSYERVVWRPQQGHKFFDFQGSLVSNVISVVQALTATHAGPLLDAFQGADMGRLIDVGAIKFDFVATSAIAPLRVHNSSILAKFVDVTNIRLSDFNNSCYLFTGAISNLTIDNCKPNITDGNSFLALDSSLLIGSEIHANKNAKPESDNFDFYQQQIDGTVDSVSDLSALINGTIVGITQYKNTGLTAIELSGDVPVYVGLNLTVSGTTGYNGIQNIVKDLYVDPDTGNRSVVVNFAFGSPESSGSVSGSGSRLTLTDSTSPDYRFIYEFRQITITNTTSYNDSVISYNGQANQVDIQTPFAGNESGDYVVSSLDQSSPQVVARDNGSSPDSQVIADISIPVVSVGTPPEIGILIPGDYYPPTVSANATPFVWTLDADDTSRFQETGVPGELQYIGIKSVSVLPEAISILEKVGGGSDKAASRLEVDIDNTGTFSPIAGSEQYTQNNQPTQVISKKRINLKPLSKLRVTYANLDTADNLLVYSARLLI